MWEPCRTISEHLTLQILSSQFMVTCRLFHAMRQGGLSLVFVQIVSQTGYQKYVAKLFVRMQAADVIPLLKSSGPTGRGECLPCPKPLV